MARARDKWTCQKCKRIWKMGERRFDIHHLNGECGKRSRTYDRVKDIAGLITYCHRCHLNEDSVKLKMRLSIVGRYRSPNAKDKPKTLPKLIRVRGVEWFKKNHLQAYQQLIKTGLLPNI